MKLLFPTLSCLLLALVAPVQAQISFPITLSSENTHLSFEVDSTWHLIQGVVEKPQGSITQEQLPIPRLSVKATFPVQSFNTDGESRDEKLREVMHAHEYPDVSIDLKAPLGACDLHKISRNTPCKLIFSGDLIISGNKKNIDIPVSLSVSETSELIGEGIYSLLWADYGVEDPSIFIAKLKPSVTVHILIKVPYGSHS